MNWSTKSGAAAAASVAASAALVKRVRQRHPRPGQPKLDFTSRIKSNQVESNREVRGASITIWKSETCLAQAILMGK